MTRATAVSQEGTREGVMTLQPTTQAERSRVMTNLAMTETGTIISIIKTKSA